MSQKTRELMKDNENLLQICLDLRMSSCGSSDPLDNETHNRYLDILWTAIKYWEPSIDRYKQFDDAVYSLCEATLKEVMGELVQEMPLDMYFKGGIHFINSIGNKTDRCYELVKK